MKKFKYKTGQKVQYRRENGDTVFGKIVNRFKHPTSSVLCYLVFFPNDRFESELHGETTNFAVLWEGARGFGLGKPTQY